MLRFTRAIDAISDWTGKLLSPVSAVLMLILLYEILMRRILNSPTSWVHETTALLYVTCFTLGASYGLRHKAHVAVDVLHHRLSPRGKAIADIVTSVFLFITCWVILWYGSQIAWESVRILERSSSPWGPPVYPTKTLIAVSGVLLALQAISKLVHDIYIAMGKEEAA